MKKEKVLLYTINPVTISYLQERLSEYTIHNGHYPDYIDMPEDVYNQFVSLFKEPDLNSVFFRSILVRKV